MKSIPTFLLIVCLLALTACLPIFPAATPVPSPTPFLPPTDTPTLPPTQTPVPSPTPTATSSFDPARLGTVERDLIYCVMDGVPQTMDVYFPASAGPWPVIVTVHGGGWTGGDKASADPSMTALGYLVVSINYRLYPQARFPAMIQDVKCAIRSLRAHAADFDLDPARIGLTGHSAGGHLAALAGLADESAGFDVGEYLDQSSRVQAVVVSAGPVDLARSFPDYLTQTIWDVFGQEQLASGSPVNYISPDDPPFFIMHGDLDSVVPLEQGQTLYQRLVLDGISAQLIVIHNGDHGYSPVGGELSPNWQEVTRMLSDFWRWNLR